MEEQTDSLCPKRLRLSLDLEANFSSAGPLAGQNRQRSMSEGRDTYVCLE